MTEEPPKQASVQPASGNPEAPDKRSGMHVLAIMVAASILAASTMVGVALMLYYRGADQLDLSRPGFSRVRKQVGKPDDFAGFASTGELTKGDIEEFLKLYDSRINKLDKIDDYSADVLAPEKLGITSKSAN